MFMTVVLPALRRCEMTSKTGKKNIIFSVSLLAFLLLLSLIRGRVPFGELSEGSKAFVITFVIVILPCISGVLLKVIINDKKSAVIIALSCSVLWAAGDALIYGEMFFLNLLICLMIFPMTILFYFITFLVVTSKRKKAAVIIAAASALFIASAVWVLILPFTIEWAQPPAL